MIKNEDDTFTGIKTTPFNYTGRTVLGRKSYRDEINAELLRVIGMKGRWSKYPNGYKDKYPDSWETEVKKVVDRKNCDVSEIMDYCVSEGKRIYQNTEFVDTFMIFHDGLSQWWEKDAQQYLHEAHNFKNRQVHCYGQTNMGTRYEGKVVGDSPEICRALDSHGFADFKVSIAYHTALTSVYDNNDERRLKTGNPHDLLRIMTRCWEMEPTSKRIVEDITKCPEVLQKVIDHKGCIVKDECLRTGQRACSANDEKELKHKQRLS